MKPGARRSFLKKTLVASGALLAWPWLAHGQGQSGLPAGLLAQQGDIFSFVRQQLLLADGLVYLNTGSLGPSPRWTIDRIIEIMHQLEANPVTENWGPLGRQMELAREKAAGFLGAATDEIVLTRNTTEGLSLVGASLHLQKGDEILTTNHEHPGGLVGLRYLARKAGARLVEIPMPMPALSQEEVLDVIEQHLNKHTKMLMLSHVSTITGMRMPWPAIASLVQGRDILLVADGAQAPGMLAVDVKALGVDVYATSGHKWLLGPKETGVVYFKKAIQDRIKPVFTDSGYATYSASSGTRNVANIIALGATFDWLQKVGMPAIEAHVMQLADYAYQRLAALPGVELLSPAAPELRTALVSIRLTKANNRQVFQALREQGIVVKVLPKYNALRFSHHLFNTTNDVDILLQALEKLV